MKGYLDFIVKPIEGRYNNKKNIDGKELILNTELENHNYVSRYISGKPDCVLNFEDSL